MNRVVYDLESDGLLDTVTRTWCIELFDIDDEKHYSFGPSEANLDGTVADAIGVLVDADLTVGHNIVCYDHPVLEKLHKYKPKGQELDTLVMSRLVYPEIKDQLDFPLVHKKKATMGKWIGRHSLESWGIRLGEHKGDYGKQESAWDHWSKEMQDYCRQDVRVTYLLYKLLLSKNVNPTAIALEHDFQRVIHKQETHGFPFDTKAAQAFYAKLAGDREKLTKALQEAFPAKVVGRQQIREYKPEGGYRILGYEDKYEEFNPGSRDQIAERFKEKYNWEPLEFTEGGTGDDGDKAPRAKISEEVLAKLTYPEAILCSDYLACTKMIGMLADGKNGWLRCVKDDGRIHGRVITNGAVTGRCTHSAPNIAQTPAVPKLPKDRPPTTSEVRNHFYAVTSRSLFGAIPGMVLVGADAASLELRCLAHYLGKFDGGKYADLVCNGDIHTANQQAAGLPTRDNAKTFIYGWLYGAGPEKLGSIVAPLASPGKQRALGMKLTKQFLQRIPATAKLKEAVVAAVKDRGYLIGLDGRHLRVRSMHSALNALLQSAGALAVKQATVFLDLKLAERYTYGKDYAQVAHIHDEIQMMCRPEIAEEVGRLAVESIKEAGEFFKFRCPLDGEFKVGTNWAETH